MLGHVITIQSEFPTESNTKTEIKAFMDRRSIEYKSSDKKSELLTIVDSKNPWKNRTR